MAFQAVPSVLEQRAKPSLQPSHSLEAAESLYSALFECRNQSVVPDFNASPSMSRPVPIETPREAVRTLFNELDLWDVEEKLNHVRWTLAGLQINDRTDPAHSAVLDGPPDSERSTVTKPLSTEATVPQSGRAVERAVGAMQKAAIVLITCGVVVLAWSWMAGRPDLPDAGLATSTLGILAWLAGWCMSLTCRLPLRSGGRFS